MSILGKIKRAFTFVFYSLAIDNSPSRFHFLVVCAVTFVKIKKG